MRSRFPRSQVTPAARTSTRGIARPPVASSPLSTYPPPPSVSTSAFAMALEAHEPLIPLAPYATDSLPALAALLEFAQAECCGCRLAFLTVMVFAGLLNAVRFPVPPPFKE